MNKVNLKRLDLLDIVKKNREQHVQDFQEAVTDYEKAVVVVAKKNLARAKLPGKKTFVSFPPAPVSYEDNYKKAERMLELSTDEILEIEDHVFNQLVMDEWGWKQQFVGTSALYKTLT